MSDITMCGGFKDTAVICPKRESCHRYTAPKNPYWQAWFVSSPWFNDKCDMYWENSGYVYSGGFRDNNEESGEQQGPCDVARQPDSEDGPVVGTGGGSS